MLATQLMDGLTLFEGALPQEQICWLEGLVESWLELGRAGILLGKSYQKPPDEWMERGQSREMIQFGVHVKCNKITNAAVQVLPDPLVSLLDQLQACGIFSASQRPDSCCINVYEQGSWLPPHVDSEAFDRPFFTLSLLSSQTVVFGESIRGADGVWSGELSVVMPVGSVLRLEGMAAGPYKHALPCATKRRISLTFRKLGSFTREHFRAIHTASRQAAANRKTWRARREERKRASTSTACDTPVGRIKDFVTRDNQFDVVLDPLTLWKWTMREIILSR